jgi:hypothetical protein
MNTLKEDRKKTEISAGSKEVQDQVEKLKSIFNMLNKLEWTNEEPKDYLERLVQKFGRVPDILAPQKGGLAAWEGYVLRNTPFARIEIHDNLTVSRDPVECYNFVRVFVRFDVLSRCFTDVHRVSPSLFYMPQEKLLCATGPNLETCVAILELATEVGNCKRSVADVEKNLALKNAVLTAEKKYGDMVNRLSNNIKNQIGIPIVDTVL